jgi:hypothetical protein
MPSLQVDFSRHIVCGIKAVVVELQASGLSALIETMPHNDTTKLKVYRRWHYYAAQK